MAIRDYIKNPVITGDFKPKFYWVGNYLTDAERINRPHIKAEGERENRIKETINLINELSGINSFTFEDALNIQNSLLKENNWRGIEPGLRKHPIIISKANNANESTPDYNQLKELVDQMFPVTTMPREHLLEWYKQIQTIHPFSDLNGRVFGIIVSVLNMNNLKNGR